MAETEKKIVATHNGRFHADDVFACAALSKPFDIEVKRTRDQRVYEKADFRADVGDENDPETNDFDHHRDIGGIRDGYFNVLRFIWRTRFVFNWLMWKLFGRKVKANLPYAAFGLIWKKFGVQICGGNEKVAKLVETWLVIPIDAQDCGYRIFQGKVEGISPHTISNIIDNFNPAWDETGRSFDVGFFEALDFAKIYLDRIIARAEGVVRAGEHVLKAIAESDDPRIVVLNDPMPYSQTTRDLEDLLLVVHRVDNGWMVHTVNAKPGSGKRFRKDLPKSWPNSSLARITGVADARFCHQNRHFAIAESREGAITLAKLALNTK